MSRRGARNQRKYLHIVVGSILVAGTWPGASALGATITLEVWNSDASPSAMDWYNSYLVPAFEKSHPGVKVTVVPTPWGQALTEKIVTSYAGGKGPGVIYGGSEFVDMYVENGLVIPLDAQIKAWGQLKDYIPATLGAVTYKGRIYGLPMQIDFRTVVFNRRVFLENGIDPNSPPSTWDEFAQLAKRLTRRNGDKVEVAGMVAGKSYQSFNQMLWQNGGDVFNEDKTAPAFAGPEGIEALTYWANLMLEISGPNEMGGAGNFINGKIAMMYQAGPHGLVRSIRNAGLKEDEILGLAPALKRKVAVSALHSNWMGVGSQSKHPELAWEFIRFHSELANYVAYSEANNSVPARLSALRTPYVNANPWLQKTLMLAAQYGKATWTARDFPRLRDTLNPELNRAFSGQVSPREALENAARAWAQILSQGR